MYIHCPQNIQITTLYIQYCINNIYIIYYNIQNTENMKKASWCPSKLQLFSNLVFQENPKSKTCVKTENLGRSVLLCSNVWDSRVSTKLPSVQIVIWATTARTLCIAVVLRVHWLFVFLQNSDQRCSPCPAKNWSNLPRPGRIVKIVVGPKGARYTPLHNLFSYASSSTLYPCQ